MPEFTIGRAKFSSERTVVIAEAGVNHLGRFDYAEKLVAAAAKAGADIIKFQTYKARELTTKSAPRFWSWEGEVSQNGTQFDSYSRLDKFGEADYVQLINLCNHYEVEFLSTPFDFDSVDMLERIGIKGFKVASCDITNFPLLEKIASKSLPVILSTGASTMEEIEAAVGLLENCGVDRIAILHCTLTYPTPPQDANLSAITEIANRFPNNLVGLSDHTLGPLTPAIAVTLGARVIEKHFTFDKSLPDSADHWLSVDESELGELVANVRHAEQTFGSGRKQVLPSELLARQNARRSLVAARNLEAGTVIGAGDIGIKRPGTGLEPGRFSELIGKTLKADIEEDHMFSLESDFDRSGH